MVQGNALIARSIDQVLEALDGIVERALEHGSRLGYFAALYRKVTARVRQGIEEGFFDDGERMEGLDVLFANRYLAALASWQAGRAPTRSWQLAFAAAERSRPLILQQLLAGINAHINLDLGIAAAETAPGAELGALGDDFQRINEILFALVGRVQEEIGELSPWIVLLDRVGGRTADELVRFSMEVARREAWDFARDLAPVSRGQWGALVQLRDRETALVADAVLHPQGLLAAAVWIIRCRETNDVRRIIETLSRVEPPALGEVEARLEERRRREHEEEEESAATTRTGDGGTS